jgi:uncharacterized membrane protein
MAVLVLLNNFLHDFSAAGWIFGTVILWAILRKDIPSVEAGQIIAAVLKIDMLLMRFSLTGIIVFGLLRALAYKTYEWNAAAGKGQITLLVVKHIILAAVLVVGLGCYFRARKIVRKVSDESKK